MNKPTTNPWDELVEAFKKTTKGTRTLSRYDYGGGRMYTGEISGERELIADTYHEGDREFIALCYDLFETKAVETLHSRLQETDRIIKEAQAEIYEEVLGIVEEMGGKENADMYEIPFAIHSAICAAQARREKGGV